MPTSSLFSARFVLSAVGAGLLATVMAVGTSTAAMAAAPPHITSGAPTSASQDDPYSFQIKTDSTDPVTFSESGNLPGGLELTTSGLIFGNPREVGDATFTVRASNGTLPDALASYTITVAPPTAPIFVHKIAPGGVRGYPYSFTVREAGSDATLLYLVTKGVLPDGLALTPSTGEIHGKPTLAGPGAFFTVTAFDGGLMRAARNYAVTVTDPVAPVIVSTNVPDAVQGEAYHFDILADGIPFPHFSLAPFVVAEGEPTFPVGLTIDPVTGALSGPITSSPGLYTFFVEADNGTRPVASQQFFLTVKAPTSTVTPTSPPTVPPTTTPGDGTGAGSGSGSGSGNGNGNGASRGEGRGSGAATLANTGSGTLDSWPSLVSALALITLGIVTIRSRRIRSIRR